MCSPKGICNPVHAAWLVKKNHRLETSGRIFLLWVDDDQAMTMSEGLLFETRTKISRIWCWSIDANIWSMYYGKWAQACAWNFTVRLWCQNPVPRVDQLVNNSQGSHDPVTPVWNDSLKTSTVEMGEGRKCGSPEGPAPPSASGDHILAFGQVPSVLTCWPCCSREGQELVGVHQVSVYQVVLLGRPRTKVFWGT